MGRNRNSERKIRLGRLFSSFDAFSVNVPLPTIPTTTKSQCVPVFGANYLVAIAIDNVLPVIAHLHVWVELIHVRSPDQSEDKRATQSS